MQHAKKSDRYLAYKTINTRHNRELLSNHVKHVSTIWVIIRVRQFHLLKQSSILQNRCESEFSVWQTKCLPNVKTVSPHPDFHIRNIKSGISHPHHHIQTIIPVTRASTRRVLGKTQNRTLDDKAPVRLVCKQIDDSNLITRYMFASMRIFKGLFQTRKSH